MRVDEYFCRLLQFGIALTFCALFTACGGDDSGSAVPAPSISIEAPTSAPSYFTTWAEVRLGGPVSRASFVHVTNALTGFSTEGFVNYNEGIGSWFADVSGLGCGENPITVTADADGSGARTATAHITVIRPLQPADLILNGPDRYSPSTFWTDENSFEGSHEIALFADGTGRSTTGSSLFENAGSPTDFTWTKLGPDSIMISNCPTCSFQRIFRISGSFTEELFLGQIETVGGDEDSASHVFNLYSGKL